MSTRVCVDHRRLSKMVMGWLKEDRTMRGCWEQGRAHVLLDLPRIPAQHRQSSNSPEKEKREAGSVSQSIEPMIAFNQVKKTTFPSTVVVVVG